MCSPNFPYIEGYHFGATEIPLWFVRLELGFWIILGLLVIATLVFILRRYPQTRTVIAAGGIVAAVVLAILYLNTFVSWCGPFEPTYPTNEATIGSIVSNDGVINNAYFHARPRKGYWSENPVDISDTSLAFVCLTEQCTHALDISDDGKQLTIRQYASGTLYACQESDEISIHIRDPAEAHTRTNLSEFMPENCTVRRPRDLYWP